MSKSSAGSLDGPWARLQRAWDQATLLHDEYGVTVQGEPYEVRPEIEAEGREYSLRLIASAPPIDEVVPFILGECLHNFRSTLDNLVFQLHIRRYHGNVPDDAALDSAFPIKTTTPTGKGLDPRTWREVKRLGASQRAAVKRFQPYIRRNQNIRELRSDLRVLRGLNNIDKHRSLHVLKAIPAPIRKTDDFATRYGLLQHIYYRPLEAGTEVERWRFTANEVPSQVEVEAHVRAYRVWSQVVIDEPTVLKLRIRVQPTLGAFYNTVNAVLGYCARFFPNDQPYGWRGVPLRADGTLDITAFGPQ